MVDEISRVLRAASLRNETVSVVSRRGRVIERVSQRLFSFIDTASSCFVTVTR